MMKNKIILAIILFAIVFLIFLYAPTMLKESKEGQPYTMNYIELLETIELKNTSHSVTYDFIAKKNIDNLGIIIHFNKFPAYTRGKEINNIEKMYKDTYIVLYDKSNKEVLYSGIIGRNFISTPPPDGVSTGVPISSSVNIQNNHQYSITIKNLPPKTDLDQAYNSFILVIGDIKKPWL